MAAQDKTIASSINIDEKTMRDIMGYLKVEDHDVFVGYIKTLGIAHED